MKERYFREIDVLWRLVETLTVEQAAALIVGEEPSAVVFSNDEATHFRDPESGVTESIGISRVNTAYKALISAISSGKLEAQIFYESRPFNHQDRQELKFLLESSQYSRVTPDILAKDDEIYEDGYYKKRNPNWSKTTLKFDDISAWLKDRGFVDGFFFPKKATLINYLDPNHPRFSSKLAAAIKVWEAMEDQNLLSGKATKDALNQWLESRYKELALVHNGKISNNAIKDVVVVANWQTVGGAPKTPE